MRFILFVLVSMMAGIAQAQEKIPVTNAVSVEGEIKKGYSIALADLNRLPQFTLDSFPIYSHNMQHRKTIKKIKAVSLKELLAQAEFNIAQPKFLSEYYFVCVASDNYKVVFSWNEIFNTEAGNKVGIIVEADGQSAKDRDDPVALFAAGDKASGRRYVKGLQKIIVMRVK